MVSFCLHSHGELPNWSKFYDATTGLPCAGGKTLLQVEMQTNAHNLIINYFQRSLVIVIFLTMAVFNEDVQDYWWISTWGFKG